MGSSRLASRRTALSLSECMIEQKQNTTRNASPAGNDPTYSENVAAPEGAATAGGQFVLRLRDQMRL